MTAGAASKGLLYSTKSQTIKLFARVNVANIHLNNPKSAMIASPWLPTSCHFYSNIKMIQKSGRLKWYVFVMRTCGIMKEGSRREYEKVAGRKGKSLRKQMTNTTTPRHEAFQFCFAKQRLLRRGGGSKTGVRINETSYIASLVISRRRGPYFFVIAEDRYNLPRKRGTTRKTFLLSDT